MSATTSKTGLDDWFARDMGTRLDLDSHLVDTMPPRDDEWDRPIPLDDLTGPAFPLDALPGQLGTMVEAVATSTQTDSGLGACMALGAVSAAGRGQYVVHVPGMDWNEPVIAQIVAVLVSGERKTAVVEEFRRPIEAKEQERRRADAAKLQAWESERRVRQKHLDQAETDAGKDGDPNAAFIRQAAVEELIQHDAKRPVLTVYLLSDATPEASAATICEQRGAAATLDDEGQLFANILNPYGKGKTPAFTYLLHGHNHGPLRITRKTGPDLYVPRAAFSYAVACQPHVIEAMGGIDGFRDRGGAARILPAFLSSRIGRRTLDAPAIPPAVREKWAQCITDLLDHSPLTEVDAGGYLLPCPLTLNRKALERFRQFWHHWESHDLRETGEFGADRHLRSWGSKFPGAVLRIAGLLHLGTYHCPEDHPITLDTLNRAIAIGQYFAAHALIFHRVMDGGGGQSDARAVLAVLETLTEESLGPITRRNLHRRLKGRRLFRNPETLTKPLLMLEDLGWIRRTRATGEQGGRPSELIELNPWCQSAKNAKTPVAGDASSDTFGTLALPIQAIPNSFATFPDLPSNPTLAGTDDDYTEVI